MVNLGCPKLGCLLRLLQFTFENFLAPVLAGALTVNNLDLLAMQMKVMKVIKQAGNFVSVLLLSCKMILR